MSKPPESSSGGNLSLEALLLAMLTLQVDERERNADAGQIKTELLLASVGLTYQQIAAMMNKSPDAVRMMLTRTRKADAKQPNAKSKGKK